jgi:hypothetical protein
MPLKRKRVLKPLPIEKLVSFNLSNNRTLLRATNLTLLYRKTLMTWGTVTQVL